jgi:hypothetical protein
VTIQVLIQVSLTVKTLFRNLLVKYMIALEKGTVVLDLIFEEFHGVNPHLGYSGTGMVLDLFI